MQLGKLIDLPRHAIIDIGSNSIHLCIYECDTSVSSFAKIVDIKDMVGLVNYIQDGIMVPDGVQKAIDSLIKLIEQAKFHQSDTIFAFATASIRNCQNSSQVVAEVSQVAGTAIDLLDGQEEAHLGFVGIASELAFSVNSSFPDGSNAGGGKSGNNDQDACGTSRFSHGGEGSCEAILVADIGGGSTELTVVQNGVEDHSESIPKGSLSLRKQYVVDLLPTEQEFALIKKSIASDLGSFRNARVEYVAGIGGTIRGAARVLARLKGTESVKELTREEVEGLLHMSVQNPLLLLDAIQETVPDRAHTLIPGCAILQTIMETCDVNRLMVCQQGIREGYLVERVLKNS